MIQRIVVPGAPAPQGCYSPAVQAGDFLFLSGQGPIDPATGEFRFGCIEDETRLVLANIQTILEGCGASLASVVKCSVFLASAGDFAAMNSVYAEHFSDHKPARTTVQATLVETRMKVEIDCVAYHPVSQVGA